MADIDQVYDALRKADAAGNVEDAKRLADYIRQLEGAPKTIAEPEADTGFFDMGRRAIIRGGKQTGSLLADVLPAMVGKAIGADEYAARQMKEAEETQKEIQQKYAARYGELKDVKGLGDVLPFIAETVLEQVPNIATALVPGVGGAGIGASVAARQAAKTLGTREATEAVARYAALKEAQGAAIGSAAGTYLGSYALNAPEIFQNIYETTKDATGTPQMELGASLLAGSVSAALDSIFPAQLINKFTPGMKAGVVEKILERSGMAPGIARSATAGVLGGVAAEAPTEAAQEAISIAAEKFVQANAPVWDSKDFNRIIESAVRGGVGGGGIGGVGGALQGVVGRQEQAAKTKADLLETQREGRQKQSTFDQIDMEFQEPPPAPPTPPADFGPPDTFYDEANLEALGQIEAGEVPRRASPIDALVAKQKELLADIRAAQGYVTDLRNTPGVEKTDERVLEASAYLQDLQQQERDIRKQLTAMSEEGVLGAGPGPREQALRAAGLTDEEIQARREKFGEPGVMYPVTADEARLTVADLVNAGVWGSKAEEIIKQAKQGKVAGATKTILQNVAAGKIEFPDGWRTATKEETDVASDFAKAKYAHAAKLAASATEPTLLAPVQEELPLEPAKEGVERGFSYIEAAETPGFTLERPPGVVPESKGIEVEEGPPTVPLDLAKGSIGRVTAFLKKILPASASPQQILAQRRAIINFTKEIRDVFQGADKGAINEFFNQYSLTSDPNKVATIVADVQGKSPEQQLQLIKNRTKFPDLTKASGVNELRHAFQDFMERRRLEGLGYAPGMRATKQFTHARVPTAIANLIRNLRMGTEKTRSKEEQAAFNYFNEFNFGLAMKSAAYDIASNMPHGEIFSNQGAKQAKLFQKYIHDKFPKEVAEDFDQMVKEYWHSYDKAATNLKKLVEYRHNIAEKEKEAQRLARMDAKNLRDMSLDAKDPAVNMKPLHPAVVEAIEMGDLNGALDILSQSHNKYWASLAARLRELDLPTAILTDSQERLVKHELGKVEPSFYSLMNIVQDAYPDLFDEHFQGRLGNTKQVWKGLQALKEKLPADVVKGEPFNLVYKKYEGTVSALSSLGSYFISDDIINLNSEKGGLTHYGFFHEVLHAATAHAIRNEDQLNSAQQKALQELRNVYAYAMEQYPAVHKYGFTSLDEFVAEAFSNQDFQRLLSTLKYKATESNLWSKFIHAVMKMFGAKDTALFATLANADILMSATTTRGTKGNALAGSLNASAPKGKRVGVNFKTGPVPADVSMASQMLGFLKNRPDWQTSKTGVAKMIENLSDTTRKYYLGAFTLRQLQDIIGGRLGDSANNFINSVEDMLEERNSILDEVKTIADKWERFQSSEPEQNKKLSLLMIDATLAGIDPSTTEGAKRDATLANSWANLHKDGKEIYILVRNFYEKRIEAYKETLARNIELSMIAKGEDAATIKAAKAALYAKFDKDKIQPYFPLKRFGQYWLQVGEGKGKEFYMFDSAGQRNAFRDELARSGERRTLFEGNSLREAAPRNLQDITLLDEIERIVDGAAENDPIMQSQYVAADKKVDTLRAAIKDGLEQLYYLTLPDKSVRKMFINRRQVSGASQDMMRAFVDSSFHMAYQHSRFKYSRRMFEQLNAADAVQKDNARNQKEGAKIESDYVNELFRRLEYIMTPTDTGKIPSALSNISFIWYLTAPASAFVNMMGVPAIGFPVLSARFGSTNTAGTLLGFGKKFLTSGFKDADGKFAWPSLGKTDLTDAERQAYNIFVSSGLIDITQSHDLAGIAESPSNMYTGRMSTVMKGLSSMFHHAERFNREVVAMSAFKMAYDRALKAGDAQNVAFKKAVDQAKDLTYRSMFDYTTLNKPRYLQNAYAKVILQFKQFPQQMTYLLARSGFEWLHNPTEEQIAQVRDNIVRERLRYKQPPLSDAELDRLVAEELLRVQKEGRDRLMGTLGMTFLFAGATGMPLFSVGSAVIESLYSVFADDDEPPLDFENWFKNWLAMNLGNFWGDSVSRGLITQATGLNLADRMGLNDLWFRDSRKSQDEVTAFQNMLINLMGPTAALGISAAEALKLYNDGHYERGAEKLMPAILKQPMVAARYATEGVLTLKGDELVSNISAKEALAQSLGFSPERVAQRQKANIEEKTMEQEIIRERQDLMNAFFMSVDTSNGDLQDRVLDKVGKFNAMYPSYAIKPASLMKSIKTRYKARALAEISGGIPITKNLMATLSDMGYYGETD